MEELRWSPIDHVSLGIYVLRVDGVEVARVQERVGGENWASTVACHRRDWRRRPHVVAPSQATAMRWAHRWTMANLARIKAELPRNVDGRRVYPASNPEPPKFV